MRILVVGAGATGGYFGGRLAEAGRDVTFLVRPARAQELHDRGLQLVSPHGDTTLHPPAITASQITSTYDLVFLAVKAFALEDVMDDVGAAVGPGTLILPVLNGMRHIDRLAARFGQSAVLGGVCLVTAKLDDEGRVVQLSGLQELVYGERDGSMTSRIDAVNEELRGAGFEARSSPTIVLEMWEKWAVLATLGGITCLMRGTVGEIVAAPGGVELALQLLAECAAAATAAGYPPREGSLERARGLLTQRGSALTSSMYRDLVQGRRVEADQIVGDLLARARHAGVETPVLAAAFTHLTVYGQRLSTA